MSLKIRLFMFILLKLSTITTEQKNEQSILDLRDFQDTSSDGEILNYRSGQPSETDILESPPIYESDPYDKEQPDNFSKADISEQSSYSAHAEDKFGSSTAQFRPKRPEIREEVKQFLKEFLERRKSKFIQKPQEQIKSIETEEAKKCLQRDEQGALVFDVCKDEDSQEQDLSPEKQPAKQPKPPISIDSTPVQDEFLNSNEDLETFSTPTFEESVEASELSTQDEQEQDSLAEEAELSSRSPEQSSQSEDSSVVIEKKVTKKEEKREEEKAKKPKDDLGSLAQTLDLVKLLSLQNTIKSVEKPVKILPIPRVVVPVSEEPENCLKLWSEWSPTTDCSQKCGGCAQQSFRRKCLSAPKCPCDGITFKAEICNLEPCRSPQTRCCDNMTPVLTATGDYICGKSDGNSNLIVQPQVVQAVQPQVLELQPTNTSNIISPKSVAVEEPQLQLEEACCADPRGTWSSWRAADQCNKECGGFGRQNRKRLCLSTPHGCPCIGNTDEVVACNLRPCPFSAKTPSSCAPGLTIQFRSNNPLCISPEFQATQQSSFNTNRGQPNQQQRNQVQSNPQRFQPSNARQSFGGPNVQFDGGPVQVREELSEDEENDQVDTGDVIQKNKSASQEVIELNKTDKREDISFADNNLFEAPLDKLAERIENGEQKPNPDSEFKSEENLTFPVDVQYSNRGGDLPQIRNNDQTEVKENQGLQDTTNEKRGNDLFKQNQYRQNSSKSSSPEHIDLSSTDPPNLPDASSTSKPVERDPLTRSKRQVQQPSTLQTPATTQNQLDYQRFLQQQASGTNSLLTNQPATLGSTISYSDLFGYSSNAANSNPQPNTQQLLAGNTYPFTSPIAGQISLGPGPLQIQANLPGIQTPTAATEDRTGQAALVGIHPGQLEWQEDQARAAAGRVAVAIPAVAAAASSSGLQRAGVDPGTTSSTSATQSSSFFLGINNQGRSFNQRNGRVLTIIPGYLVVQSSSADVAARLLSQLKPNRLGLGSKSSRLSVIYPALRPQGTANQPSAATAATNVAASAVAQALANQVALLNAASTNSNAGPAALELTRPGTSQSSSQGNQVLVGTGQVVNNQDNGFGGINPISVGGFAGFDTGDSGNIQQGQEEAPVYFEGQARNLDEEEPVVEYAPAVQAYRKIKEQDLDDNNSQKDETNRAILAEDGIEFGEELVSKDEFDSKIGISNQFEEMNADMEVMKKMFGAEQPLEKEIVPSNPKPLNWIKEQPENAEDSPFHDSYANIISKRFKRQNSPNQQGLLTSLQRQLLQNGANSQAGYQNQVRQPNPVANLLAMRRLQQQYLQKLLRERLTRLQQPQNTNNNQQSETFGGTALQQGEANAPPGSVPNDAGSIYVNPGSIQSPAQPALGPSEGAGFNLSTFNISNLVALLGSANLSGSNFSVSSDNLESEKNNSAPASLTDQVGLKITSSSDQRLAEAIAQSRASDQAVPRPITEQQPNQQDEIPPLLPSGQIQTPINTFAGTSRTQPGVMDDRQSISNVYSNFEQVNGTSLTVPPINAATQSGSQVAGSNPAESGNSVPNNTLQAIRQQQQTAILAAIFARAASLGNTGGVAPVEAPLPNGPLQPKFQPQSAHTAQKTSITSSQTAGGYAVPPGLVGVPTSPSAQKSAASSQSQSLSQRLKAFLASQKSSAPVPNPIQAPKPVVQPASPPNQQPLNSQIAVLQQQIRALLAQQQQLNRQSNTQQQLQRVIQVLNANSASIQPPAQSAVLTIQPQIQSQNTPVSNLQIQSLQPQNVKESIPPGYAIVQQPIYVIQQPAVSQPVSNQNVVRVNANNLRQQLLQSQRLQQLQKIQEQQQSRNSLQSIYVDSGGSSRDSTKNVGSNNYYMSGIGFDLNTAGDRTRPSTRANQGNIAQNRGQGNNLVENFQQRVEQPQRPIQIQQSRKSSQSYQQNRGSLISPSQSQFTRQPNCCVTGGIWDLWSEWSGCGTGCGGCGIRKRTRLCASAAQGCPCSNEQALSSQTEICNRNPCSFPDQACCGQLKPKLSGNNYVCA